mgnify:CR=1 FL=1
MELDRLPCSQTASVTDWRREDVPAPSMRLDSSITQFFRVHFRFAGLSIRGRSRLDRGVSQGDRQDDIQRSDYDCSLELLPSSSSVAGGDGCIGGFPLRS